MCIIFSLSSFTFSVFPTKLYLFYCILWLRFKGTTCTSGGPAVCRGQGGSAVRVGQREGNRQKQERQEEEKQERKEELEGNEKGEERT